MSADLLARAAEQLREHAAELPNWLTPGGWIAHAETVHSHGNYRFAEIVSERPAAIASYLALMDPTVALALAAWLDVEAKREAWHLAEFGYRVVANEATTLARAILREP